MAKAFNEFLHNHLILSDENRIVLLSQLAKMQIASGNLQEAKITMQETESFSNIIQSPNFLYKYAVSKVDVATRLFIQTSIDDLKEKKEHPSLDDLDALYTDSHAHFNSLMEEIHRDYAILKIEMKEIPSTENKDIPSSNEVAEVTTGEPEVLVSNTEQQNS